MFLTTEVKDKLVGKTIEFVKYKDDACGILIAFTDNSALEIDISSYSDFTIELIEEE